MAAVEEELDFSSYLVDLEDDGGVDLATNTTNAAFAASSYVHGPSLLSTSAASSSALSAFSPSASTSHPAPFQPLQTHSAKNWPAGLLQQHQHIAPISPSPPESASDSSYKASSNSTAGTAPSSIASTSYPDSGSSWGTQKTLVNPKKSHTSNLSSSLSNAANSASRTSDLPVSRKPSSTESTDQTPPASSSATATATSSSQPALSLSFNYDFAHNPALNDTFSPPAVRPQAGPSSSFQDTFDLAQYSSSLPSGSSRPSGFSSRHGSSDRLSSMNNTSDLGGKPLSPSSGPQHVAKGHRSRQASASANSLSSSLGTTGASPHWLSMTPSTPSMAIPQFASTPYSRPLAPATSASDSSHAIGSSLTSQQGSASSSALHKRPSKRKNASSLSQSGVQQAQADLQRQQSQPQIQQFPLNTTSNYLTGSAPGVQQFGFPIPGPAYRDPASAITSPISPSLDSFPAFANFLPQTAASSTVASPTNGQLGAFSNNTSKSNSNASTPNDAVLSAVTAPSPFDPKNFGMLSFDPLSEDFNAQLANLGAASASQSPSSAAQSQAALEVTKAAALAGIGGKWINWTNTQEGSQESDAALISNVLTKAPEVLPTSSSSSAAQPGTAGKGMSSGNIVRAPGEHDPFPARTREGSVLSNTFGDIDGESPEELAARDPLATHLWRLYAKAKAGLPNGARMENITWRMMGLKLNKQKADAAAGGNSSFASPRRPDAPLDKRDVDEQHEERGRRGRSTAPNSASPGDDFVEMDWRQQSRSRSRVPQAIAGGMDWRAQSRSRSRAPNMRISMPSGPSGFHLPTYADIVETMASVSRAPQDVSVATAAGATQPANSDGQSNTSHSRQVSQSQMDLQEFERTLKQYIADTEATNRDAPLLAAKVNDPVRRSQASSEAPKQAGVSSSALPYTYVPPAPLPISAADWASGVTPEQNVPGSLPSSVVNHSFISNQQATPSQAINGLPQAQSSDPSSLSSAENALLQSQKSISASVEAYLSSLEHQTSVIDLPPHRHVGSIPGLFNEQELKANQHADYGFLPKLVRKTSFDASYPAQLAHEQQKQSQKKRAPQAQAQSVQQQTAPVMPSPQASNQAQDPAMQNWMDPNNLFLMDNINGYLRSAAQSVPSTPSVASANLAFNSFFANLPNSGQSAPFSPYAAASPEAQQAQQAQAQNQALALAQAQAQTAAVEAFRRLQAAQAMQVAAQQQQQQQQQQQSAQQVFTPYHVEGAFSPGVIPPELLAAMSPGQFSNMGMHVNPSQVQYPPNAFPKYGELPIGSWPGSPQANQTSPGQYPSPEDYGAAAEEERLRSAATSRSSSIANIPSLLSQSFTSADLSQDPNTQAEAAGQKTHNRQQSTVTPTAPSGDASGSQTVCVNCKTTNTPLWRRDEMGNPLCNACQLFRKLHGSDRPVSLHNSVVKKRNRTRNKEAPKKSTSRSQRRNSTSAQEQVQEDTTPEDQ